MLQNFSYHTHSTWSDGCNTLREMLDRAVSLGWKEIGFSDHLIVHKDMKKSPSWLRMQKEKAPWIYGDSFAAAAEKFKTYKSELLELAQEYPLKIYFGAEVDYFPYPEWKREFRAFQNEIGLDYYISSNHFLIDNDNQVIDPHSIEYLGYDENRQKELLSRHFRIMAEAVASGLFTFLAHLDYMRRVKICTAEMFWEEKTAVIKALAEKGMPVELSTKGLTKSSEMFPARKILQELKRYNIPVVISDDAHETQRLGADFKAAETLLKQLNYANRWKMHQE